MGLVCFFYTLNQRPAGLRLSAQAAGPYPQNVGTEQHIDINGYFVKQGVAYRRRGTQLGDVGKFYTGSAPPHFGGWLKKEPSAAAENPAISAGMPEQRGGSGLGSQAVVSICSRILNREILVDDEAEGYAVYVSIHSRLLNREIPHG